MLFPYIFDQSSLFHLIIFHPEKTGKLNVTDCISTCMHNYGCSFFCIGLPRRYGPTVSILRIHISNRPCYLQDTMISTCRQAQPFKTLFQQFHGSGIKNTIFLNVFGPHLAIAMQISSLFKSLFLDISRLNNAFSDSQ